MRRLLEFISLLFLPLSRTKASQRKSVALYQYLLVLLKLTGLGLLIYYFYKNGLSLDNLLNESLIDYRIQNILAYLAMLMPLLALAVLLRNMNVKDNVGLVLLGFSVAFIIYATTKSLPLTLLISSLASIGLASLTYNKETVLNNENKEKKGVGEKWW